LYTGLIEQSGKWYKIEGDDKSYNGESQLREALAANKEIQSEIRRRTLTEEEV
jgi:hypothetical protein